MPHKTYSNDYHDPQWRNLLHSSSPRSMTDSRYKSNREISAMSDPGVGRRDENYGQSRSRMEYAQSEIGSPSAPYYESQQRSRNPSHYFQEERHSEPRPQYSQKRYSPPILRRKSLSPSVEQQVREAHALLQQRHSREVASRGNSPRANEGYYGSSMPKSSPSYNGRSFDTPSPSSAVNVKEIKRQLWNNREVLNVRDPSDSRYNRKAQQSLSPKRHAYRRGSPPPPNNVPRYSRSLSPRRRQYQGSPPMVDESPSPIQKASSTMSETSYNRGFHSKFVEAALMAQKHGGGNNKIMESNQAEYSQKHHPAQNYQQQQQRRRHSLSSRPLHEGDLYRRQSLDNNKVRPPSPHTHYASNTKYNGETRNQNTHYHRGNESDPNASSGRGSGKARRPPIIPPSPSYSPAVQNNEQRKRPQQRHRGRSIDPPQFRGSDGIARRMRPPSPLLLDRIRSFEQDYHNDSYNAVSEGQNQRNERESDYNDQHVANDSMRVMSDHDNLNHSHDSELVSGKIGSNHYLMHDEHLRRQQGERLHNDMNHFDGRRGHAGEFHSPTMNRSNVHGSPSDMGYQENDPELPHNFSSESAAERMAHLVEKLSAVNRADPTSALKEIDSILRQESRSRSSHGQKSESRSDGDKKYAKTQNYRDDQPEYKFAIGETNDIKQDTDHFDDQSDVSSLTNPVFQLSAQGPKKHTDALYIQESDRYNMHPTQNNNLMSFNPSTSSFRRPRPSHLQNYSNEMSKDQKAMSRSEWKRQQLEKSPPPTTITLKDDQDSNESSRQSSKEIREMMLQKNLKAEASRSKKTDKTTRSKSKKKLGDKIVSGQQDLGKKIRSYDESSSSQSRSHSEQGKKVVRRSTNPNPKPHPWDSSPTTVVETVETKDTSMEDAMGVEAEISIRDPHTYMRELDVSTEISVEGSRPSKNSQGNHFQKARNNIKNRRDNNPFNDPSVDSSESQPFSKARFPDISDSVQSDSTDEPNMDVSMDKGIPQFNPSHQHQAARERRDREEKKTDGGTNSWVDLPPSSYFPDINDSYEPVRGKTARTTGSSGVNSQLNVSGHGSISRLACKPVELQEPKPKEKKRGFLNKFMDKKKSKARGSGYTASEAGGFRSANSTSLESRGVKSTSHIPSSTRMRASEPTALSNDFLILAAPPGVLQAGRETRGRPGPGRRNSRGRSASARRNRSKSRPKSSEKFRSNNMAQKFNRVMQIYDSDET